MKPKIGVRISVNKELLKEIIADTSELVRRAAHPRKGTIALSPETAALLERISVRPSSDTPAVAESPGDGVASLQALAEEVSACTKCDLCQSRTQTVFADGSPTADLVFVGEAPGYSEDEQGIPFVGRSGQLLTD
ncbi:MAG: hypothetical protein IIB38_13415, partial [Candidatus Hydrogenedentes bacterium]|nr:hypothetical protein [Candidatus Hydrogenedentota bacterium]